MKELGRQLSPADQYNPLVPMLLGAVSWLRRFEREALLQKKLDSQPQPDLIFAALGVLSFKRTLDAALAHAINQKFETAESEEGQPDTKDAATAIEDLLR